MSLDAPAIARALAAHGPLVRVLVLATAGSVPRGAGTSMLVWGDGAEGTIGGGALELAAVEEARAMLAAGAGPRRRTVPLGPALRQCCGGSVTLAWDLIAEAPEAPWARPVEAAGLMPPKAARRLAAMRPGALPAWVEGWVLEAAPAPRRPLWVWGAGHVGRALVGVLAPLPDRAVTWVDVAPDRFPAEVPEGVEALAGEPVGFVGRAPESADHLVVTRSHDLDLALCHALLGHGFASLGLIGSETKRARFRGRLAALGHSAGQIARVACPIGDPALGKHPQAIAIGVAASLIAGAAERAGAQVGDRTG